MPSRPAFKAQLHRTGSLECLEEHVFDNRSYSKSLALEAAKI